MAREKSLFKNYFFNLIKTLCSLIFPLITFTYSARVLGAEGVGRVSFTKSIMSYFTMLAMLGMGHYGTREGAKLRDDRDKLSKFAHEMLMINSVTTIIAYLLLFTAIRMVPKLSDYTPLILVNSLAIVLQGMGMEWLYQAVEEYKYIAIRSVVFQIGALMAMFLFVRDAGDVLPYATVTLVASSGSYIMNFFHARKYISIHWYGKYEIKKHLKPLLCLFSVVVSIELYTVLDSTMLGFLQGDVAVGKYTAAVKVNKLVNTLITAIGVVLIPRLSYYIGNGELEKIRELIQKAFHYVFVLSVPAAIGLFMLSDEIILLFSGPDFSSAGFTMRLLTPIVLVIPISVILNVQTFVPLGKEKLILMSTLTGAAVNFACNSLLIPRFAENGAAIATVIAETAVTIVCIVNANKFFDMRHIFRGYGQYWLAALPIPLIAILFQKFVTQFVLRILLVMVLSAGSYFGILLSLKNPYVLDAIHTVRNLLKMRSNK